MPNKPRQPDPIGVAKRKSTSARRVAKGRSCSCGENRPLALIPGSTPLICTECSRKEKDQCIFDKHHPAGRNNHSFTVPILANDHRAILSDAQQNWPQSTIRNSKRSPLIRIAACVRGAYDTIIYFLNKIRDVLNNLLLWIPETLEKLDKFLELHLGSQWWTRFDFLNFNDQETEHDNA